MNKEEIKDILNNCNKAINEASGYNDTTNKLLNYIEQLENKIDKAIEILETYKRMLSLYSQPIDIFDLQDVIEELKGDSE